MKKALLFILSGICIYGLAVLSGCGSKSGPAPAPSITSISPTSGVANTAVTIVGNHFETTPSDNTVKFNGVLATVQTASATSLVVMAPATGTTGAITVTTADGTATGPVFTYNVVANPPSITSISPTSGNAGVSVTITGTNFKTTPTDNTVKFNGVAAKVQTATATSLTVLAPAAGTTGAVSVTTLDGTVTGPVFTYTVASGPDVYLIGKGNAGLGFGYWKNGVFTAMPAECLGLRGIYVSGTDVYVSGTTANGPTYWKNGVGVTLPMSAGNSQGLAYSIFVSGNDVYVGGYDVNSGGGNTIPRYWKNGVGTNVPLSAGNITANAPASTAIILSIFVSGGDVYLAGYQYPSTTDGHYVATYWKNGVPKTLTDGTKDGITSGIYVSGSDAYVSGADGNAGFYWKNGVANALTVPVTTLGVTTQSIYVNSGDVYVSGYYKQTAKYWKNGVMVDLSTTTTIPNPTEYASGITGLGNDLYISGSTIAGAGFWKNTTFSTLPSPGANFLNGVFVK